MVGHSGWYPIIHESTTGAWQRNELMSRETILNHHAVYACTSLIATDIAKCGLGLEELDDDGIWSPVESPAFSPVLRKPNHYQNRIQYVQWWEISKLIHGNVYGLKIRDERRVVRQIYILDPCRVRPMVAPDGSVFYALGADNLSKLDASMIVPAREIMHEVMVPLYHPLCGVTPLFACALAGVYGIKMQEMAASFFANGARPGGILMAPGSIKQTQADEVKAYWETNFSGDNSGKIAILGDGMTYQPMTATAVDAQLAEQMPISSQMICTAFRVPPYMIGAGPPPNYDNIEALTRQYYSQCLQYHIESFEMTHDEGLGIYPDPVNGRRLRTAVNVDDLWMMDTATLIASEKEAAGIKTPNESRRRLNLPPVKGGDTPYLQVQNYSLAALDRRDREGPPLSPAPSPTQPAAGNPTPSNEPAPATTTTKQYTDNELDLVVKAFAIEELGGINAWTS